MSVHLSLVINHVHGSLIAHGTCAAVTEVCRIITASLCIIHPRRTGQTDMGSGNGAPQKDDVFAMSNALSA